MLTLQSIAPLPTPAYHCAFTSLCQYQGMTYVAYRQAQSHNIYPPGHAVIQRSADLETWEMTARMQTGGDDRDPHLVATANKLYCLWGSYVPTFDAWTGRVSLLGNDIWTYGAFSHDGDAWGPPYRICRPGSWLWSCVVDPLPPPARQGLLAQATRSQVHAAPALPPTWYGVSYDVGDGVVDQCHTLTLWRGASPLLWERWKTILDASDIRSDLHPSEPALFWKDTDTLGCVVRMDNDTLYGTAPRPFTQWAWQSMDVSANVHAPAVLEVPGYGWLVAGREYAPGKKKTDKPIVCCTTLWRFDPATASLREELRLPSQGDCSYPGLVWDSERQEVLVSWYSQHECDMSVLGMPHTAKVYLARLTVDKKA